MTVLTVAKMADAAIARNIRPGFDIAAGYYGGPRAFRIWPRQDWLLFPGFRLPVWVGGLNGAVEGAQAVTALRALAVPEDSYTALDMETRKDKTYVAAFGAALAAGGYRTWVYGSSGTVYLNPQLNGYWPAHFGLTAAQALAELDQPGNRAIQYEANLPPGYDASLVRAWTEGGMWHG